MKRSIKRNRVLCRAYYYMSFSLYLMEYGLAGHYCNTYNRLEKPWYLNIVVGIVNIFLYKHEINVSFQRNYKKYSKNVSLFKYLIACRLGTKY